MSCRIHVICEDHTLDQYVVRPVVQAMAAAVGRPRARVKAVPTPPPRGIEAVLRSNRRAALEVRRRALSEDVARKVVVLLARQELEVWAMWGARARLDAGWAAVRAERDPKDVYWPGLLETADATLPGRGRQRLIKESLDLGWASVCGGCPELAEATEEMRARLTAGD